MPGRIYLGITTKPDGSVHRAIFRSEHEPTQDTHGSRYNAVIGPFRTVRGAEFMRQYGQGNPHCRTVAEAERLALKYQQEAEQQQEKSR